MGVRRYQSKEDEGWEFDWDEHLGYKNPAQNVDNKDIVFWAVGHLSHNWTQADENNPKWHETGWLIDVVRGADESNAELLHLIQLPLRTVPRRIRGNGQR
jgi:hypothetical protein